VIWRDLNAALVRFENVIWRALRPLGTRFAGVTGCVLAFLDVPRDLNFSMKPALLFRQV
jgi:hypothetical protein